MPDRALHVESPQHVQQLLHARILGPLMNLHPSTRGTNDVHQVRRMKRLLNAWHLAIEHGWIKRFSTNEREKNALLVESFAGTPHHD